MMKRILIILFVVVVGIAIINDVGRYIVSYFNLSDTTQQATLAAARVGSNRDAAAVAAASYASDKGVTVYAFDMDGSRVFVYTEMPLDGTWVLAPIMTTIQGGRAADDYMLRAEHSSLRQ